MDSTISLFTPSSRSSGFTSSNDDATASNCSERVVAIFSELKWRLPALDTLRTFALLAAASFGWRCSAS